MVQAKWRVGWSGPTVTDAAFTETMGWPSEMPEEQWKKLIHADDITGVLMEWYAAFHRRRPVVLKFRMLDKWGECRWIISMGLPDPSGDGYEGFFLVEEPVKSCALN